MKPTVHVNSLTFSDGTVLNLSKSDVVVIVGPNNAGKSESLKNIQSWFSSNPRKPKVVQKLDLVRHGSITDLSNWLENFDLNDSGQFATLNASIIETQLHEMWPNAKNGGVGALANFFVRYLNAEARLGACKATERIRLYHQPPRHPIHVLERDAGAEVRISKLFRSVFGQDLIVNRNAGSIVQLHCGECPDESQTNGILSVEFQDRVAKLPTLESQGDGMKCFSGILLNFLLGDLSVFLIDEPEAFLHPPHAKNLGQILVNELAEEQQLFVATHSSDILRGIIDSNTERVHIVRIDRELDATKNTVSILDKSELRTFLSNPILRYSNVLDGLFHRKVVVCESDSDCQFYEAILQVNRDSKKYNDILFIHCGGKDRLSVVVKSLRALNVETKVIADFDVLSEKHPLKPICESLEIDWKTIESDWKAVKDAVDSKGASYTTQKLSEELSVVMNAATTPKDLRKRGQQILKQASVWTLAKEIGSEYIRGEARVRLTKLIDNLNEGGLFVVPVGELEGFDKSVGNHGPKWVLNVLEKDLKNAVELSQAREFVSKVVR